MKYLLLVGVLVISVLVAACGPSLPKACTKDARICPDGSAVGRVPPDCEFAPCPQPECDYDDSNRPYLVQDIEQCSIAAVSCPYGSAYFSDSCGCGCLPEQIQCDRDNPNRQYIGNSTEECSRIRFVCADDKRFFADECGCGCESGAEHICDAQSRQGDACLMIYQPVCGWFDETVQCIRYPCAKTYGNSCEACHDRTVRSWTEGECPK